MVNEIIIPNNRAIRIKITPQGNATVGWWLSPGPFAIRWLEDERVVDVISYMIWGKEGGIMLYDIKPGNYTIITCSEAGNEYEVVVEAFIPR